MMKQITFMTVFLLMIFPPFSGAQSKMQQDRLQEIASEQLSRFEREKAEAIATAIRLGIPVRAVSDDGNVFELMRIMNGRPVYYSTHNALGADLIRATNLYPNGSSNLNLTGAGQSLGIWDAGSVRTTHAEFLGGRANNRDGSSVDNHATHVAGTMAASGVKHLAKGVSYESSIDSYDWNNDNAEMAIAAFAGLSVSQHSYGSITGWYPFQGAWYWFGEPSISQTEDYYFGYYNNKANQWDEIAHNAPYYLIVKSAGNDRGQGPAPGTFHYVWINDAWQGSTAIRDIDCGPDGYNCIPTYGNAKNIVTVGAVTGNKEMSSFSSWGPTDDGRIKPDIVAKGVSVFSPIATSNTSYDVYNGTSMSGPMVSGALGLLLELQMNLHPGVSLLSSTKKGLLLHSADDDIGGAPGPDYRFGWGLLNVEKAASIMSTNALTNNQHIQEHTLNEAAVITVTVRASGTEPLRATIVWTDPPGTPVDPPVLNAPDLMLVNDLDLRITDSGNNTFLPYFLDPANPSAPATNGDNFRDNVEMVHIANPIPGEIYTITIGHKGTLLDGSQDFSLIITGNEDPDRVMKPQSLAAHALDNDLIRLDWTKNPDNQNVMLVWAPENFLGMPFDGIAYNTNDVIPGGGTVLYKGMDQSYIHTGLSPETNYFYKVFSYNSSYEYSLGREAVGSTLCANILELPIFENFDGSSVLPDCWKIVDHIGNGQVWEIGTHQHGMTATTGNYIYLNSFGFGSGGIQNADLVSPIINMSEYDEVTLRFTHFFRSMQHRSSATLSYSTDGGFSWSTIKTWIDEINNPTYFNEVIPEIAGQSQVRLKWNFTGELAWWWNIDDIFISGVSFFVPQTRELKDMALEYWDDTCFDAMLTITVGGDEPFIMRQGARSSFIAGQNILLLPNTRIKAGAELHAYITTANSFCSTLILPLVAQKEDSPESAAYQHDHVLEEIATYTEEIESAVADFMIYPNPTDGRFTLTLYGIKPSSRVRVEVIGMRGESILSTELPGDQTSHTLSLGGQLPGIYFIRILSDEYTGVKRIIKR